MYCTQLIFCLLKKRYLTFVDFLFLASKIINSKASPSSSGLPLYSSFPSTFNLSTTLSGLLPPTSQSLNTFLFANGLSGGQMILGGSNMPGLNQTSTPTSTPPTTTPSTTKDSPPAGSSKVNFTYDSYLYPVISFKFYFT